MHLHVVCHPESRLTVSNTPTIDHLVIGEFVTGPPSYRLVMGEFAYSSWISTNAENKENTVLFDRHLRSIVGSVLAVVKNRSDYAP